MANLIERHAEKIVGVLSCFDRLVLQGRYHGSILEAEYAPDIIFRSAEDPNRSRQAKVNVLLSNSFGFGGTNCCIVAAHPRSGST